MLEVSRQYEGKVRAVYEELEKSEELGEKLTLIIIRLSEASREPCVHV